MNRQTAVEEPSMQFSPGAPGGEGPVETDLKSERVQEGLRAMAAWTPSHEAKAIESVKVFPTPEVAGLYGAFVSRYASAAGFPVTVSLSGGQVSVSVFAPLLNGCAGELTESVLAFARLLG